MLFFVGFVVFFHIIVVCFFFLIFFSVCLFVLIKPKLFKKSYTAYFK